VRNGVLTRFTIFPNVPELYNHPKLKFDVTQRVHFVAAWLKENGDPESPPQHQEFPAQNEEANDETGPPGTITLQPTGPAPNGHLFYFDAPGISPEVRQGQEAKVGYSGNHEQFVRVRLDGTVPSGDTVSGSRASDVFKFHVHHLLVPDPAFGGVSWKRTSHHDPDNDIGADHIAIGTVEDELLDFFTSG
jgi:hypothetical protein